jgi:hypothetical protein
LHDRLAKGDLHGPANRFVGRQMSGVFRDADAAVEFLRAQGFPFIASFFA